MAMADQPTRIRPGLQAGAASPPRPAAQDDFDTPQGTVTVLGGYTVVLIVLWGFMYYLMVARG